MNMSLNKDVLGFGSLNKNIRLAITKIKDYSKFTLYQVYRHVKNEYIPIYKTTLEPHELKNYEVIEMYE